MSATTQHILAAAAVFISLLYLVLRGRRKKDCGSGCNCGTKKPQVK